MELLSLWGIDLWAMVFGRSLIATRLLAFILDAITLILPYCFLLTKEQRNKHIYYLCGAFVIMGPAIVKLCNPDTFTAIVIACLITCAIKYFDKQKFYQLLLLVLFSSLAILVRFPNIVIVPFLTLLLIIKDHSKKGLLLSLFYICSSLIIAYVSLGLLLQSKEPFAMILHQMQGTTTYVNEDVATHSITALIGAYINSAGRAIITIGVICVLVLLYSFIKKKTGDNSMISIIAVIIAAVLLNLFLNLRFEIFGMMEVVMFLTIVFIIPQLYDAIKARNKNEIIALIFIIGALCVPASGTDCGFTKSLVVSCAFLPVFMSTCPENFKKILKPSFVCAVVALTSISIYTANLFKYSYTETVDNEYIECIFETPKTVEYVNTLQQEIEGLFGDGHVIFLGDKRDVQMLYFINNCKPVDGYNLEFSMKVNSIPQIERAIQSLNKDPQNVIIDCGRSNEEIFLDRGLYIKHKNKHTTVYSF